MPPLIVGIGQLFPLPFVFPSLLILGNGSRSHSRSRSRSCPNCGQLLPPSQIGTDTMSMKDAMGRLKQQALEFSVKSQKETEAAAAARAAAAAEYDKVAQELAEVKGQVRAVRCEL